MTPRLGLQSRPQTTPPAFCLCSPWTFCVCSSKLGKSQNLVHTPVYAMIVSECVTSNLSKGFSWGTVFFDKSIKSNYL